MASSELGPGSPGLCTEGEWTRSSGATGAQQSPFPLAVVPNQTGWEGVWSWSPLSVPVPSSLLTCAAPCWGMGRLHQPPKHRSGVFTLNASAGGRAGTGQCPVWAVARTECWFCLCWFCSRATENAKCKRAALCEPGRVQGREGKSALISAASSQSPRVIFFFWLVEGEFLLCTNTLH